MRGVGIKDKIEQRDPAGRVPANTQSIAKTAPSWDIDLGSVQRIGQLCLLVAPGAVLRDVCVSVSERPFRKDEKAAWSNRLTGPYTGKSLVDVGAKGRYLRLVAAELPLDGVDLVLPTPSDALPGKGVQDALAISGGDWKIAEHVLPVKALPYAADTGGTTLRVSRPAGERHRITFDLDGSKAGGRILFWWNGTLIRPSGFEVLKSARRCAFDVLTTGAVDKLTFKCHGTELSPKNLEIDAEPLQDRPDDVASARVPSVRPKGSAARGVIEGVLRRTVPSSARGRMAAQRAMAAVGLSAQDKIVFR